MICVENLEPRLCFSANPATSEVAVFRSDEVAVKADVTAIKKTFSADLKIIKAEIKTLGAGKSDAKLVTMAMQAANAIAKLMRDAARQASVLNPDMNALVAKLEASAKNPNDLGLDGDVFDDENRLSGDLSNSQTSLSTDGQTLTTTLDAALNALASANPTSTTMASDVNAAESSLNGSESQITATETAITTTDESNVLAVFGI